MHTPGLSGRPAAAGTGIRHVHDACPEGRCFFVTLRVSPGAIAPGLTLREPPQSMSILSHPWDNSQSALCKSTSPYSADSVLPYEVL